MSPLVAYHCTRQACRQSIEDQGLLAACPMRGRPHGVYVFRLDGGLDHPTFTRGSAVEWGYGGHFGGDLWRVAYVGRLIEDHYVTNGLICLDSIPPSDVALVTGN